MEESVMHYVKCSDPAKCVHPNKSGNASHYQENKKGSYMTHLFWSLAALTALTAADPQPLPAAGMHTYSLASAHYGTLTGQLDLQETATGLRAQTPQYSLDFDESGHGRLQLSDGRSFDAQMHIDGDDHRMSVAGGPLRGEWHFAADAPAPQRDYPALVEALHETTTSWLYDPRLTETPVFTTFLTSFGDCANTAQDDAGLIVCFDQSWDGSLFSHYEVLRPLNSMDGLLEEADAAAEDRPVARYEEIEPGVALVTIDSFFGIAIEEQIDTAMTAAIHSDAQTLIVDLRENGGGTIAALPVASRILETQQVLGVFIANAWWQQNDALPEQSLLQARPVLNGRDQNTLMGELVATGYTAASLAPADLTFGGTVYVLTSARTGSAAEALVGMIKMTRRATLIGETTAGEMLSSTFFPLPSEFSLRIPVADFYLSDGSRIDGVGVAPDIAVAAADALERALVEARLH
jgi:carboxyl-terminal processing protease